MKIFSFLKVKNSNRGIAVYFAAVVLSVVLTIALGVSYLSTAQIKNLNESSNAVIAFAAAETGIEWALKNVNLDNYTDPDVLPNEGGLSGSSATYVVTATKGAPCAEETLCVKSVGSYNNTQRAIRIER